MEENGAMQTRTRTHVANQRETPKQTNTYKSLLQFEYDMHMPSCGSPGYQVTVDVKGSEIEIHIVEDSNSIEAIITCLLMYSRQGESDY